MGARSYKYVLKKSLYSPGMVLVEMMLDGGIPESFSLPDFLLAYKWQGGCPIPLDHAQPRFRVHKAIFSLGWRASLIDAVMLKEATDYLFRRASLKRTQHTVSCSPSAVPLNVPVCTKPLSMSSQRPRNTAIWCWDSKSVSPRCLSLLFSAFLGIWSWMERKTYWYNISASWIMRREFSMLWKRVHGTFSLRGAFHTCRSSV